jgi:hypothetical protein
LIFSFHASTISLAKVAVSETTFVDSFPSHAVAHILVFSGALSPNLSLISYIIYIVKALIIYIISALSSFCDSFLTLKRER